ncbi:MAG: hypothetical protein U0L49_02800 [Eubacterium sp.]|nr:hypothetical protein [Eubacterium sp.]
MTSSVIGNPDSQVQKLIDDLKDREIYQTDIGPVCMSKKEHERYLEELEERKLRRDANNKQSSG